MTLEQISADLYHPGQHKLEMHLRTTWTVWDNLQNKTAPKPLFGRTQKSMVNRTLRSLFASRTNNANHRYANLLLEMIILTPAGKRNLLTVPLEWLIFRRKNYGKTQEFASLIHNVISSPTLPEEKADMEYHLCWFERRARLENGRKAITIKLVPLLKN